MFLTLWRKLTHRITRASRRGQTLARRRPFCRLELENLETRLVPATHTWLGATDDGLWSNPNNWNGGTPSGDSAAALVFPDLGSLQVSGPAQNYDPENDLPGLTIQSINFNNPADMDYWFKGKPVTLTGNFVDSGGEAGAFGGDIVGMGIVISPGSLFFDCKDGTIDMGGPLSSLGVASLNKIGSGELVLGNDTHVGPTNIYQGPLTTESLSNGSAVTVLGGATFNVGDPIAKSIQFTIGSLAGTGTVNLNGNSLTVGGDNTPTDWGGTITGTGKLVKAGTGTFTLGGQDTYTGGTTIAAGTLYNDEGFPTTGTVTVSAGATLQMSGSIDDAGSLAGAGTVNLVDCSFSVGEDNSSTTFSGILSGSGTLVKVGSGTFTLTGPTPAVGRLLPRDYLGAIEVYSGTLQLGVSNVIAPTCAVTVDAGPLLARARWDLNGHSDAIGSLAGVGAVTLGGGNLYTGYDNTPTTFSGNISGTGGLYKEGTGTFTLSPCTYSGVTEVDAGTLQMGASSTVIGTSAVTVEAGATFDLNNYSDSIGSLSGAGHVTLGNGILFGNVNLAVGCLSTGYDNTSTTFSGVMSGQGSLYKEGTGTFTLTGPNTQWQTVIDAGTLRVGNIRALPSTEAVVVNARGTFDLNNLSVTIGSLSGTGNVKLGGGSLNVVVAGNVNTDFGGVIGGTGSLYKQGAGTLSLSGSSTYTGETFVYGGTLLVTGSLSPSGVVEVTSGASLWGSGMVGNVDVTYGGLLFPNVNGGIAMLKTGKVWFDASTIFTVCLGQSLSASGTVDLSNGPMLNTQLGQLPTHIGGTYTIIQGTAIIGTFQGLPEHSKININGQVFQIHYSATSVVLTRIL